MPHPGSRRFDGIVRPPRRPPAPGHDALSRRDFLTGASAVAGTAAIASLLGPAAGALEAATTGPHGFGGKLDDFIRHRMHRAYLTSVTAAAVRRGRLVWSGGYGLADREQRIQADADSVYMLASISKTFICAAVMQLWEAGSIDLDADVDRYLPFDVRNPAFPDREITARMLLTHTSSIRDRYTLWGTVRHPTPVTGYTVGDSPLPLGHDLARYLVRGAPYFEKGNYYPNQPGSKYRYSNLGADTAAYLVEAITGTPFGQYCLDNLLTPLGMADSGYHLSDLSTSNLAVPYRCKISERLFQPYPQYGYGDYPCGCMRTSANALSIWLRCFMNGGTIDGTRILKASTVREIMRPQLKGLTWGQGLIWYRIREAGDLLIGHNGSDYGVSTNMYFAPRRDVGVITLTNRSIEGWNAWYDFLDIQDRLFDIV